MVCPGNDLCREDPLYPGRAPDASGHQRYGFMDRGKPDAIFLLKISLDKYKPMVYMLAMTSDELRKWREVNGYSQARLAKALTVAVMTVSRWERGVRAIPPFLHLALRFLELEGGGPEIVRQGRKKKTGKGV